MRVFSTLILLLILSAPALAQECPQEPCYRIGIILPLTGAAASVGQAVKNGFTMGLGELSSSERARLFVHFEDSLTETNSALSAYQRLKRAGIDVVIPVMSNVAQAIINRSEMDRIAAIALAVDPSIPQGKAYAVQLWANLNLLAARAVEELLERKQTNVAVVATTHEGNLAMARAFEEASRNQVSIKSREEINPGETDFRSVILRLKARSDIDAIANFLHPSQSGLFARQAKHLGLNLSQFALGNFEDLTVLMDAGGALEGGWFTAIAYLPDYLRRYRFAFPGETTYGSASAYDAVQLLRQALRQQTAPADLASLWRNLPDFSGSAGRIASNGRGGFSYPIKVYNVHGAGFE